MEFFDRAFCTYFPLKYFSPSLEVWPHESLIIFSQNLFSSFFTKYISSNELSDIKAVNEGIFLNPYTFEYSSSFVAASPSYHSSINSTVDFLQRRCPGFFLCRNLVLAFRKTLVPFSFIHLNVSITIVNQLKQSALVKYYFYKDSIELHYLILPIFELLKKT